MRADGTGNRGKAYTGVIALLSVVLLALPVRADAGLLGGSDDDGGGGLLGTVFGIVDTTLDVVGGLLGVVDAGWDDGVETPPTPVSLAAEAVGADVLWAYGIDGEGVDVAVIDTGIAPVAGLDGAGKVVNGPDLSFDSNAPELRHLDGHGHGTHLAGIIAGSDGPGGEFSGIAPGARLVNVRVGAQDGAVDVSQVIAAIDWVVQHQDDAGMDIRVLHLAFGTDGIQRRRLDPLVHAVETAWRSGLVVVVAAGNAGSSHEKLANPALSPFVIAAGAVDLHGTAAVADDTVPPFSSRTSSGRTVDVVAPGVSLASLRTPGSTIDQDHPDSVVDERYFRGSGTSQAAAVTSGAAALLLDARPSLTPDEVKWLLRTTATPVALATRRASGRGRISVLAAATTAAPLDVTQGYRHSRGIGSLEAARGTNHVADDGVELVGEYDIMGQPFVSSVWAPAATGGTTWDGGTWNGSAWTGDCWCATSWSGTSWEGRSWTGRSWTGRSWTGRSWTGRSWTGDAWEGRSWTGDSWTGRSWTGDYWSGS